MARAWVRTIVAASTFCAAFAASRQAEAQAPTLYLDRLNIPGSPDDGMSLFRPVTQPGIIGYAMLGFGYQLNPLHTRSIIGVDKDTQKASHRGTIEHMFTGTASVGIEFMNRFTVGMTVPFGGFLGTNPAYPPFNGINYKPTNVKGAFADDMRLDFRGVIARTNDARGAFGASLNLFLPTGSRHAWGGDGATSVMMLLTGEYDFKYFVLVANVGPHFRPTSAINDPLQDHGLGVTHEIRLAIGGFIPFKEGRYRLGVNFMTQTGLGGNDLTGDTTFTAQNTPIEWSFEGKMKFGSKEEWWAGASLGSFIPTEIKPGPAPTAYGVPDFRAVATIGYYFTFFDTDSKSPDRKEAMRQHWREQRGADSDNDGIPDDIDACPHDAEDHLGSDPSDGCPVPPDRDNDGVPDEFDKCPDNPEDRDKIDDGDGCPETDADNDGILDTVDACPKQPGGPSADPKHNGCPTYISMEGSVVKINQQVHFATGSSTILPDSFPMLQEIANLLKANPAIKRMSIDGHTDNKGAADMNKKLSGERATSVMNWLVQHGVEAPRLEAHGYGLEKPLESNDTEKGRQANRRVEFRILDQDDTNAVKHK